MSASSSRMLCLKAPIPGCLWRDRACPGHCDVVRTLLMLTSRVCSFPASTCPISALGSVLLSVVCIPEGLARAALVYSLVC